MALDLLSLCDVLESLPLSVVTFKPVLRIDGDIQVMVLRYGKIIGDISEIDDKAELWDMNDYVTTNVGNIVNWLLMKDAEL